MSNKLFKSEFSILAYTRKPNPEYSPFMSQSVHFALSSDFGNSLTPLYLNRGKLYARCRFNEENGIVSRGLHGISLRKYNDEYIISADQTERTKNEDRSYSENDTGKFLRWSTRDFVSFCELGVFDSRFDSEAYDEESQSLSLDSLDHSETVSAISVSKDIAEALLKNNVTVEFDHVEIPESVTVSDLSQLDSIKAKVVYTDGSHHEKRIKWNCEGIDPSKEGTYCVDGKILARHFPFPVEEHPWGDPVVKYYNGKYYFIATNDANGDTSFEIREADTPEGLFCEGVRRETILEAKSCIYKATYWAPEFHIIGGKLRILCALTVQGFDPQCHVMTLRDGGDLLNKDDWSAPERIVMPDGRNLSINPLGDGKNGITLDMTHFEAGESSYVVWSYRTWAGTDSGSMLMIAKLDPEDPKKLLTYPKLLTRPYFAWEHNSGTDNNEGPYALVKDGKVYLAYSGGDARGQMYLLGMMTASVNDDLLDISNWETSTAPVLASNYVEGHYGPGHNAFFTDEFGDTYITYHTVRSSGDRNIRPAIRRVHFKNDGTPLLYMSNEQDLPSGKENVKILVTLKK